VIAADGFPVTTPCATLCDADCELGTGCHERHQPAWMRDHDPDGCERQRAALDEHSRLSAELGELAHG
jgi:hypothetical protein